MGTLATGIDTSQFRGYPVDLEVFSGPLDLLLHLVQRDKIEIWEISISRITEQYLEEIRKMEALNVEVAGEFLVVAATLMKIKSGLLLPRRVQEQDQESALPETREGLIRKLLEYRRYREAAATLREMEEDRRKRAPRGWVPTLPKDHMYPLREARVTDLAAYLRDILTRPPTEEPTHSVQLEEIRLEDQIDYVYDRLVRDAGPVRFQALLRRPWWRLEWIVTFLALLELMRTGRVSVLQDVPFGEIWIAPAALVPDDRAMTEPLDDRDNGKESGGDQ